MYHRYAASKRTFTTWLIESSNVVAVGRRRHPNKESEVDQEEILPTRGSPPLVFTGVLLDQKGQGWPIQLMAAASVKIIRYVKIRSAVNPYDPEWELYLEARWGWQLAQTQKGRSRIEFLGKVQEGRCLVCGQPLRIAEEDCQSTIGFGAAKAVRTRRTTWSCCMPTVIGRSTCKKTTKAARPARDVREGLSCLTGNCHGSSEGRGRRQTSPPYPHAQHRLGHSRPARVSQCVHIQPVSHDLALI